MRSNPNQIPSITSTVLPSFAIFRTSLHNKPLKWPPNRVVLPQKPYPLQVKPLEPPKICARAKGNLPLRQRHPKRKPTTAPRRRPLQASIATSLHPRKPDGPHLLNVRNSNPAIPRKRVLSIPRSRDSEQPRDPASAIPRFSPNRVLRFRLFRPVLFSHPACC